MGKYDADAKENKQRRNANEFADEEFAQPLDEHSVEEQERSRRTGDDSISETRHDRNNR